MRYYIGVDDSDILERGGTGMLARSLAAYLAERHAGLIDHGVSRHQLLQDPRVPCTRKNRCSCLVFSARAGELEAVIKEAGAFVASRAVPGSDPGFCVAEESRITPEVVAFGGEAKRRIVHPEAAVAVARSAGLLLEPLGGTGDGVIGALAAVGLRRSGDDGWVTQWRKLRDLAGVLSVAIIQREGCEVIDQESGARLAAEELVDTRGKVRPLLDGGRLVLQVRWSGNGVWEALKPSR